MKVFIDKIAEQALKKCDELGINNPSRRDAFVGGYRYGLREGKNPWHKVSEELPEPLIYVIVRFSNNTMAVSQRTNHFIGETTTVKVTHWMEIPEIENNMTNSEKAREIALAYQQEGDGHIEQIIREDALEEMAEWKDQQFKEYLENLKNAYIKDSNNLFNRGLTMSSEHYNSQIECIDEIINKLFKED